MPDINREQLLRHIAKSDLTALEKRYLEQLVERDKQQEHYLPPDYKTDLLNRFDKRR